MAEICESLGGEQNAERKASKVKLDPFQYVLRPGLRYLKIPHVCEPDKAAVHLGHFVKKMGHCH